MKIKQFLMIGLLALAMGAQAKEYKYETVSGDMMQTRIYTLDNGLKVYLSVTGTIRQQVTHLPIATHSVARQRTVMHPPAPSPDA